jgi:hypothetical protein
MGNTNKSQEQQNSMPMNEAVTMNQKRKNTNVTSNSGTNTKPTNANPANQMGGRRRTKRHMKRKNQRKNQRKSQRR